MQPADSRCGAAILSLVPGFSVHDELKNIFFKALAMSCSFIMFIQSILFDIAPINYPP